MNARTRARTHARTNVRTHGRTNRRTDRRTDGRTHGRTNNKLYATQQSALFIWNIIFQMFVACGRMQGLLWIFTIIIINSWDYNYEIKLKYLTCLRISRNCLWTPHTNPLRWCSSTWRWISCQTTDQTNDSGTHTGSRLYLQQNVMRDTFKSNQVKRNLCVSLKLWNMTSI